MVQLVRRSGEFWGRSGAQLRVLGCEAESYEATGAEHQVLRHTHEAAHFVFVPGGGYISSARGAPDLSRLPLLVFNPPGTTHRDRFLHGRGGFMTVTIGGALGAGLREDLPWAVHGPEAVRLARGLERSIALGSVNPAEGEGLLLSLMGLVSAEPTPRAAPLWLGRAYEAIWESADPELSVAAVARDAGVHPVHLARVFNDYLGCAPGEALRGRRLERVAAVLGNSRAGLADIAADHGFADQSHMTRSFRGAFGMTPRAFRRSRNVADVQDEGPVRP